MLVLCVADVLADVDGCEVGVWLGWVGDEGVGVDEVDALGGCEYDVGCLGGWVMGDGGCDGAYGVGVECVGYEFVVLADWLMYVGDGV